MSVPFIVLIPDITLGGFRQWFDRNPVNTLILYNNGKNSFVNRVMPGNTEKMG